jgi:hypothetical protein
MADDQNDRRDDPRVGQLVADVKALNEKVDSNTALTLQIQESTAGLVEFFNDSREAFRLFNKLMNALRWFLRKAMLPLAFILAGLYAIAHDGRPPEWIKSWVDLFK